jgi:purine-binding chemotaxis protein CheW
MSDMPIEKEPGQALEEADSIGEAAVDAHQYITFAVGTEVFAVGMEMVREIIRSPEAVRVPLAPPTLEGLANLRGDVLPILSLRGLFGFEPRDRDDATRVIVVDVGQAVGFVVDRVSSVVEVGADMIEDVGSISSAVDADLLSGLIKNSGGHAMIMILDFARLIERDFSEIAAASRSLSPTDAASRGDAEGADKQAAEELRLVSFHVAEQEYAVGIGEVQEIVQAPEAIIRVPHSESHILGVISLRNRLLPLVCLRRLFALPERALDERSRIVVLVYEGSSVGLAVDGVNEVLRVAKTEVDPLPPLFAREKDMADIAQICRLDEGKRLVSILTVRNLFGHSTIKAALREVEDIEKETGDRGHSREAAMEEEEQVVVFRLDREEYGLPIGNVEEIVRVPEELIRVPKAPAFVEGVINLRGAVLPVLDLRLRMGLAQLERNDRQRIMVLGISSLRTGFIVDQVLEVLKIPKLAIGASPKLSKDQGMLLSRMANLEEQKRIIQLLDPSRLVADRELAELAAVAVGDASDQAVDS